MKQHLTSLNDDKDIIKGCLSNKQQSQEALYRKYSSYLFGVSIRYTKDYSAAEDVLHESFIKIFTSISSYKGTGSIKSWMRTIVINTALEKFRKQFQLYFVDNIEDTREYLITDGFYSELNTKDLLKLVADLPPAYKIVFNLYTIDGYSHKEIASKLNISVGTSKSNLSRARKILQTKVKEQFTLREDRKIC